MITDRRRHLRTAAPNARPDDGQHGAVAVEFALILPLLLMLVLGIIEFGFGYHAWDSTQNGAREGARLAAVEPNIVLIEDRVRGSSGFLDQANLSVTITCRKFDGASFGTCAPGQDWDEGDIVRVQVDYAYDYITPLPGFVGLGPDMAMTSVSEARFEGL
ncbi:MAG TPA: TadE/TadG family type IV pilus assembly protein [Actinomycetota bacterium]